MTVVLTDISVRITAVIFGMKVLEELPLSVYREYSPLFEEDVYNDIDLVTCVEKRISEGGTSVASVEKQIAYVREVM